MPPLPALLSALLALLAAASCAPAGAPLDACAEVRNSSMRLSRRARHVLSECDSTCLNSTDEYSFTTPLDWIVGKGVCDPGTLKHKSGPCVEKIFRVLSSYKSALRRVSSFPVCSQYAASVRPEVDVLQEDMGSCLRSKGLSLQQPQVDEQEEDEHTKLLQCHHTLDRLYSFSILAARVFAEGDPARHAEAKPHRCM